MFNNIPKIFCWLDASRVEGADLSGCSYLRNWAGAAESSPKQGVASLQPKILRGRKNSLTVLQFDGVDDTMTTRYAGDGAFTLDPVPNPQFYPWPGENLGVKVSTEYLVVRNTQNTDDNSQHEPIMYGGGGGARAPIDFDWIQGTTAYYNCETGALPSSVANTDSNWHIWRTVSAPLNSTVYCDGVQVASSAIIPAAGARTGAYLHVGSYAGGGRFFKGEFAEYALIIDTVSNDVNRNIMKYLSGKWDISIAPLL